MEFSLWPREPVVRGKLRDEGSKCKRPSKLGRHWLGPQMRGTTYEWVWVPTGEATYERSGADTLLSCMENSSPLTTPQP